MAALRELVGDESHGHEGAEQQVGHAVTREDAPEALDAAEEALGVVLLWAAACFERRDHRLELERSREVARLVAFTGSRKRALGCGAQPDRVCAG